MEAALYEGYCVKCRAKKTMVDARKEVTKNGRLAAKGKCPDCQSGICKFLGASSWAQPEPETK